MEEQVVALELTGLTGGSFTLEVSMAGATTGPLTQTSTAADVKAALEALPSVGSVDVSRVGPDAEGGYLWRMTMTALAGAANCAAGAEASTCLAVHVGSLTGTGAAIAVATVQVGQAPSFASAATVSLPVGAQEVQAITSSGTAGTFAVDFASSGSPVTIGYDATAEDVKFWLERLPSVGRVAVERTVLPAAGGRSRVASGGSSRS